MHLQQKHYRLSTHLTAQRGEDNSLEDINEAIRTIKQIICLTTDIFPWRKLFNLGAVLLMRFESSSSIGDLDTAIPILRKVQNEGPEEAKTSPALINLVSCLFHRFRFSGSHAEDLDDAIAVSVRIVNNLPLDHFKDVGLFNGLLNDCIMAKFEIGGSIDDLDSAIAAVTKAMGITPLAEIDPDHLTVLGKLHNQRFSTKGEVSDLDTAIHAATQAVDLTPVNDLQYSSRLCTLGLNLLRRFEPTNSLENVKDAAAAFKKGVEYMPHDDHRRAVSLDHIRYCLKQQYLKTKAPDTLDEAIIFAQEAVDASSVTEKTHVEYLARLGECLKWRFLRAGSAEDITRAVDAAGQALSLTPENHERYLDCVTELSYVLRQRFERFGSLDDIIRATRFLDREARRLDESHPGAFDLWNSLGICLSRKYSHTDKIQDLDQAIRATSVAIEMSSADTSDLTRPLGNLATQLRLRFERSGSLEDLDTAVQKATAAVENMPSDYEDKAVWHSVLATCLAQRYESMGSNEDLDASLKQSAKALAETSEDSLDRAARLVNHARYLQLKYELVSDKEALEQQLSSYIEAFHCSGASPFWRITSAQAAGDVFAKKMDWKNASNMFQEAVNLLSKVHLKSSRQIEAQAMLKRFGILASSAAAAALNAGESAQDALQVLELGRGVMTSMVWDMHTDVSDLRQAFPELAERFVSLREELELPRNNIHATNTWSMADLAETRRYQAEQEFDQLVQTIRGRPSFHDFLCPPTAEDLMATSKAGPIVVVNMAPYRSDAFLVEPHAIRCIQLPKVNIEEIKKRVADVRRQVNLADALEWTWHAICGPCLDALSLTIYRAGDDDVWPHVWWVPTGIIRDLPLHAAGCYRKDSHDTVMDRVISSYALTIKGLIQGRRQQHPASSPGQCQLDSALLVAMENTPAMPHGNLPSANDEVSLVQGFCSGLNLSPVIPQPKKASVLAHMAKCQVFHFAGHGKTSQINPAFSEILLDDWESDPLTVGDLRDVQLHGSPPFLAYLSACSTGAERWDHILDEGFNLVGAFYVSGFRHVIGTFWPVLDERCVEVAKIFYETLRDQGMTDRAVSLGLHRAVREMRHKDIKDRARRDATLIAHKTSRRAQADISPFWIPYFHFGV